MSERMRPPLRALDASVARRIVAEATLAPSVHNTQPWRFVARPGGIELWADESRHLHVVDRAAHAEALSCGAVLLALRLAVTVHVGRKPLTRLLPDPVQRPALLADVRLGGPSGASEEIRRLHAAMPQRATFRGAFQTRELPARIQAVLHYSAFVEGAHLQFLDEVTRDRVLDLTRAADAEWRRDEGYRSELATWTVERSPGEGVPDEAWGSVDPAYPQRDFSLAATAGRRERPSGAGTFAVLSTDGDTMKDRVRAGEALMRILLQATAEDARVALMSQSVERIESRAALQRALGSLAFPHAVLRIGFADVEEAPPAPTPRRTVDDVLVFDSDDL